MKADFAMAIHFHQPVGNLDHIIERAFDNCYLPFLQTLGGYPGIKVNLHFTGCLLEWAEQNRPELIERAQRMVRTGQAEIMSGGFYDPIFSAIPRRDSVGQIKMLSEYVRTRLSFEPKGAWIAERVWEPALPSILYDAGIKYAIVDDTHLLYAGIAKGGTYGYYMTEDTAKPVAVFPSDKVLRYHIPFKMPPECTAYMREAADKMDTPLFVYGDDAEKFGEWPGTHKWVFGEKWLEKFFDELMKNADWLRTVKLSEYIESRPPLGRVYIPTASYEEMSEWSLPVRSQQRLEDIKNELKAAGKEEAYKPFLRGGIWRNFMAKYPESNHMNKKMIYVSNKLDETKKLKRVSGLVKEAERELFKGQCNCGYWHGVFGGLYLFHLRRAIYEHLIKSQVLLDKARYGRKQACSAEVTDMDADGFDEVILENRDAALYFEPSEGGVLKEFDVKPAACNLINTLTRREEVYHKKIIKKLSEAQHNNAGGVKTIHEDIRTVDEKVKDHLDYDRYGRYSLLDHFFKANVDIGSFARCAYKEEGDFLKGRYDLKVKETPGKVMLTLKREGLAGGAEISLSKEITLSRKDASFKVCYDIVNKTDAKLDMVFGPEFNITMPDADSDRYSFIIDSSDRGYNLNNMADLSAAKSVNIKDFRKELSFRMSFSEAVRLWFFPLKTVSQSEKAYELNYQSSVILPHINLKLEKGGKKRFGIEIFVDRN